MPTFRKFNAFVEALAEGVHDLSSDTLRVALSNVTPQASFSILSDLTQIDYSAIGDRGLTVSSSSQSGGVYRLVIQDKVLVVSGLVPDFQYVSIYNASTINGNLICWADTGAIVSLGNGDTYTIDFDDTNGVLSLA